MAVSYDYTPKLLIFFRKTHPKKHVQNHSIYSYIGIRYFFEVSNY